MSLNANAKSWTPSFGGGAPAPPAAALPAPAGVAPPPPAAALPVATSSSGGAPPPPPAAALGTSSGAPVNRNAGAPPPPPSALGAAPAAGPSGNAGAPLPPAAALGAASATATTGTPLHLAPPFTPMGVNASNTSTVGASPSNNNSNNNNTSGFTNNNVRHNNFNNHHGHGGGGHHFHNNNNHQSNNPLLANFNNGGGNGSNNFRAPFGAGGFNNGFNGGFGNAGGGMNGQFGGMGMAGASTDATSAGGAGAAGGSAAEQVSEWFRYSIALPSARFTENTPTNTNNLLMLQTKRVLLSGRTREKGPFEEYIANYFANTRNASFTEAEAKQHITAQITPSAQLPANLQSPSALLLSRKMLGNPNQTDDIATVTNADGYLIQVAAEHTQPGAPDVSEYLREAWKNFIDTIGPECAVIGHWMLEVPELANGAATASTVNTKAYTEPSNQLDTGAAFYHYFYAIPKTPTSLSTSGLTQKFLAGNKVTKVRSLVSFILTDRLPLAAHVRVFAEGDYKGPAVAAAESPSAPSTPAGASSSMASIAASINVPTPAITIRYNALDHAETMGSVAKAISAVEKYLTPSSLYNNAKNSLLAAAAAAAPPAPPAAVTGSDSGASGTSTPTTGSTVSVLTTVPSWSNTAILNIDVVDVTPSTLSAVGTAAAAAALSSDAICPKLDEASLPCVTPAFDVFQELLTGLATMAGGVSTFERASACPLSGPMETLLGNMKPSAVIKTGESNNNRPMLVLSGRSALTSSWGTLPSIYASGSFITPVGSAANYSTFRSMLTTSGAWSAFLTAESRTMALTSDKAPAIANVFAREPYVVRRTAVGTRVLLLVDKTRQLAVFDPMTGSLAAIPADSWSNRNATFSDCVFVATLTHTYRGARVWRIIVEDVYRFNGESCAAKPFKERWAHCNFGALENEGTYSHPSPFNTLILHATYMNAHELHRLLDRNRQTAASIPAETEYFVDGYPLNPHEVLEPVDHATLGLTFVPVMAPVVLATSAAATTYGAELPAYYSRSRSVNTAAVRDILRNVPTFTWVPQESVSAQLVAGAIERDGKTARVYLKAAKSLIVPQPSASGAPVVGTPDQAAAVDGHSPGISGDSLLPPPSLGLPASTGALAAAGTSPASSCSSPTAKAGHSGASVCKTEPVLEAHAKRLWCSFVSHYGAVIKTGSADLVPIAGEYVEVPSALIDAGYISTGAVIECLVRRQNQCRFWEYIKTVSNTTAAVGTYGQLVAAPSSDRWVSWLSHSAYLKVQDLQWLPKAYLNKCTKCNDVSEKGEKDPATGNYRCNACWRDSGFGDCVHCHKRFTPGSIEVASKFFYCEACWQSFTHAVNIVQGPQPPPLGANLELQVMTRIASLLIDDISHKFPLRDVLDLCVPDTSVIRKWLHAGIESFTGVATDSTVAADVSRVKSQFLQEHPNKNRENFNFFACPYTFSDLDRFWDEAIPTRHPKQFSAVFCFYQLHKVMGSKESAKDFFKYLARALVPGGVFVSTFFCPNGFFAKGAPYRNDFFSLKWNLKEYEEGRARMLQGLPPLPAAAAARATSGERRTDASSTPVDAATIAIRESASSTPMPPSIDEPEGAYVAPVVSTPSPMPASVDGFADEECEAANPTAQQSFASGLMVEHKSSTPAAPIDAFDDEDDVAANTGAAKFPSGECPTTPEAQLKKQHADPNAATPTTGAAGNNDSPIAAGEMATPSANVTPLVPSKGAWKPKSLAAANVAAVGAAAAANGDGTAEGLVASQQQTATAAGANVTATPQSAAKVESPAVVATDLTIPTVGLTFQISFSESGGTAAATTANTRENSTVCADDLTSPSMTSQFSSDSAAFSRAGTTMLFTEGTRTENVIPLDLLVACADECGFELLFDYWGKASDLIAADGAWTKPLNPAAKEYFNGVKSIVFRKIAKRPHAQAACMPSALQ